MRNRRSIKLGLDLLLVVVGVVVGLVAPQYVPSTQGSAASPGGIFALWVVGASLALIGAIYVVIALIARR